MEKQSLQRAAILDRSLQEAAKGKGNRFSAEAHGFLERETLARFEMAPSGVVGEAASTDVEEVEGFDPSVREAYAT